MTGATPTTSTRRTVGSMTAVAMAMTAMVLLPTAAQAEQSPTVAGGGRVSGQYCHAWDVEGGRTGYVTCSRHPDGFRTTRFNMRQTCLHHGSRIYEGPRVPYGQTSFTVCPVGSKVAGRGIFHY